MRVSLKWTNKGLSDLARLYEFLARVNKAAASEVVQRLTQGVSTLADHPRLGEQLYEFEPREVRRILIGSYEVRYEVDKTVIFILRLWHTRENRCAS